jgi:hypothetical protein
MELDMEFDLPEEDLQCESPPNPIPLGPLGQGFTLAYPNI